MWRNISTILTLIQMIFGEVGSSANYESLNQRDSTDPEPNLSLHYERTYPCTRTTVETDMCNTTKEEWRRETGRRVYDG